VTHVRTSPYYPQSNGKLERWHKSLKSECIRPGTPDTALRGPLQPGPAAQRDRIRDSGGHARGPASGDSRGARPEVGNGARTAPTAPPAGGMRPSRIKHGVTMIFPGETEAGSAGMQPCRGIAWWAHRDDDRRRGNQFLALPSPIIGSKDPDALKIPARRAEFTLTENASSPLHAEPEHNEMARIVYGP